MIKTKIICTLGPAVDDPEIMRKLVSKRMDVARMNFSHGTHEEQLGRLNMFREVCAEENMHIPVLLDTKGPEIRLGLFPGGEVDIIENQPFILTTLPVDGTAERASVSYEGLPRDVKAGDHILLDDGLIDLEVQSVTGTEINCRALNGGKLSSRKSINVPGASLSLPALTQQDKGDILFAIEHDYDYIAVSFVRKKEDILEISRFLEEHDGQSIKLIAKIESREGVNNLTEIIRVADGIMVARGDLGVEIPVEEIPIVQKEMITQCYRAGKPVITATQMLDSMIRNPRPTRAEVTDVANAIFDGTSAIMLSGETASGKYPVEALDTMKRIASITERSIDYWQRFRLLEQMNETGITNAISHATCTTAMDLRAAAIVAVTTSGITAQRISRFRPECPIIAATTSRKVFYQLSLSWGVYPVLVDVVSSTDELFQVAVEAARQTGIVADGDLMVLTAGVPLGVSGTTNMIKVQMLGNVLCRGKAVGEGQVTGSICVVKRGSEDSAEFSRGDILVIDEITDAVLPIMRLCAGVIIDGEDRSEKAHTISRTLDIPILLNAYGAMRLLRSGTVVTLDAARGIVICAE